MRSAFVLIWSDNSQDYNFAFHLFSTFLIKCKCGELHLFRALLPSDQWPWQHGSLKLYSDRLKLCIEWGITRNVTISTSSCHKLSGTFYQVQNFYLPPAFKQENFSFFCVFLSTQPFNQNAFNFFAFLQHNKEGKVMLKTVEVTFHHGILWNFIGMHAIFRNNL